MAFLVDETFEGTGYEESWTETVGAGATVDEDDDSANAGNPPGWGSQCLKIIKPAAAEHAYTTRTWTPGALQFFRLEFVIASHGLAADDELAIISAGLSAVGVNFLVVIERLSGANYLTMYLDTNDDGNIDLIAWRDVLQTGVRYRFELKWDTTNDLWEFWAQGTWKAAGTLTAAAGAILQLLLGDTADRTIGYTCRHDRIAVDDATRPESNINPVMFRGS